MSAPAGTVRYWASARAAAGVAEDRLRAGTLAEAIAEVLSRRSDQDRLGAVLAVCSFVVDGRPVGRRPHAEVSLLEEGWVVEVLPPFAGG